MAGRFSASSLLPREDARDDSRKIYEGFFSEDNRFRREILAFPRAKAPTVTGAAADRTSQQENGEDFENLEDYVEFGKEFEETPTGRDCLPGIYRRCAKLCDWFPKICSLRLDGANASLSDRSSGHVGNYERLDSPGPSIYELGSRMRKSKTRVTSSPATISMTRQEKEGCKRVDIEKEELRFYNDDRSWNAVVVEKNLRTIDLCELLKVKRNVSGIAWSIVETWPELGIERTLEDHEDILDVHREMELFTFFEEKQFFFREDFLKYEFYVNPKQFFPSDMVLFPSGEDTEGSIVDGESALRSYLLREDAQTPQVSSFVWMRDEDTNVWKKTYLLLRGRTIYSVKESYSKYLKACLSSSGKSVVSSSSVGKTTTNQRQNSFAKSTSSRAGKQQRLQRQHHHWHHETEDEHLIPLIHLWEYNFYKIFNPKKFLNVPFEWAVYLRESGQIVREDMVFLGLEPQLKVIAFHTEKSRACWLIAMRLAKYGKQLRENYRAFKNKQCEQSANVTGVPTTSNVSANTLTATTGTNTTGTTTVNDTTLKERYNGYNVSSESVRSRVAMDFTGSVGRIVEDPKEAKDIAEIEGMVWRRRWRPFSRPSPDCTMVRLHGLDGGIHVLQPWFHAGLKREIATAIIRDHGSVDGVFLVRESKSNPGAYVLTYKYSDKVFHAQIQPVLDERHDCWLYTLDKGATKFYDLLQLIEFYQLNAGSLPTRLTHYVQNGVPTHPGRPEDGEASPSPPEANQRYSVNGGGCANAYTDADDATDGVKNIRVE